MSTLQESAESFISQQKKYDVSDQEISVLVAEITEIAKYEITKSFLISNNYKGYQGITSNTGYF
ncbi:MAG: hypothetical protein WCP96_05315 [Methylococcaceae bacterium]